jgi:hypothetical protein
MQRIQVTARREEFNGPLKVDMNNPFSTEEMTLHCKETMLSICPHCNIYFKSG